MLYIVKLECHKKKKVTLNCDKLQLKCKYRHWRGRGKGREESERGLNIAGGLNAHWIVRTSPVQFPLRAWLGFSKPSEPLTSLSSSLLTSHRSFVCFEYTLDFRAFPLNSVQGAASAVRTTDCFPRFGALTLYLINVWYNHKAFK